MDFGLMANEKKNKWNGLIGKYVRIEQKIKIPLSNDNLVVKVLEIHPSGKKVLLRNKGGSEEIWYTILKKGELKDWYSIQRYKFVRLLSRWEELEFEVSDYIGSVTEEIDFDSKTIAECKYMKQYATFEMEQYVPFGSIAAFLFALILSSDASNYSTITRLPIWTALLLGILFYIQYRHHRSRFHEIILKIEAKILSDD